VPPAPSERFRFLAVQKELKPGVGCGIEKEFSLYQESREDATRLRIADWSSDRMVRMTLCILSLLVLSAFQIESFM
jgi:hypothetical protein